MTNAATNGTSSNFPDAAEIFKQALGGFRANNPLPWLELLEEDAVLELPFNPPGLPRRISGKAAIIAYFQSAPASIDFNSFSDIRIHPMRDPDSVVAELTASGNVQTTDKVYENHYVIVLQTHEGRIRLQRDYFNPLASISSEA